MEFIVAETAPKAKFIFLNHFAQRPNTGVYSDDYINIRANFLERNTQRPLGILQESKELWGLYLDKFAGFKIDDN